MCILPGFRVKALGCPLDILQHGMTNSWIPAFAGMTKMEEKIRQDLKSAMIAKDETKVSTLRLLISELTYAKVGKSEGLTDDAVISVIQKEAKKRKESIESFEKGGRPELAEKEKAELEILQKYLPEQISDEELTKIIEEAITKIRMLSGESKTGASTMADMGKVIGMVMGQIGARAEGARVSLLVRSKLTN